MTRDEFLVKLKKQGLYGEIYLSTDDTARPIGVDIFSDENKGEFIATIYDYSTFCIQTYPDWMENGSIDNRPKKFKLFMKYMATPVHMRD